MLKKNTAPLRCAILSSLIFCYTFPSSPESILTPRDNIFLPIITFSSFHSLHWYSNLLSEILTFPYRPILGILGAVFVTTDKFVIWNKKNVVAYRCKEGQALGWFFLIGNWIRIFSCNIMKIFWNRRKWECIINSVIYYH